MQMNAKRLNVLNKTIEIQSNIIAAGPRWSCSTRMTLYFETDKADGFREPGFSKERRLEPQITVGLLTDETGFPLRAGAFEGNKAETATMIPMINDFMKAHNLDDVVVVADARIFVRVYEPDGMTVEEFEEFGPTRKTPPAHAL